MIDLKSIFIAGPLGELHPKKVHLFANRDDIDFSTADDLRPTQLLELAPDLNAELEYFLRGGFQSCGSLCMYFPDSYGGENLRINYIELRGKFKAIKVKAVKAVYELNPIASNKEIKEDFMGSLHLGA